MNRTDERRRSQPPQPQRRQPPRQGSGSRQARPGSPQRREAYPRQDRRRPPSGAAPRPAAPQRRREPEYRREPERRRESERRREYEAPRRRPDQGAQRRSHAAPARTNPPRPDRVRVPSRSYAERRRREEEARLRRLRRKVQRIVTVLMVLTASAMAVFCLYRLEDHTVKAPRPSVEAHTDPPVTIPTEPPTEPPTEAPTRPPIVVTPITALEDLAELAVPEYVSVQLVDEGNPSRRGIKLEAINDIVLHYVGNPGTTAQQNRNFYNEVNSDVSSHFVVGLNGEVIQCIPLDEKSSASNHRNKDTISIEVCHPDTTGQFTQDTYDSVVDLLAWLVLACDLEVDNVIRHYEVTGKICPKYYVENESAWLQLRADVAARLGR